MPGYHLDPGGGALQGFWQWFAFLSFMAMFDLLLLWKLLPWQMLRSGSTHGQFLRVALPQLIIIVIGTAIAVVYASL